MHCALSTPTLYEDWSARRHRLANLGAEAGPHAAIELRLLDYLLRRFRGSPEADRPAVFRLTAELIVNERAAAVHLRARVIQQHLAQGNWVQIANARQAQERVASVLRRMASSTPVEDASGEFETRISGNKRRRNRVYARLGSGKPDERLAAINFIGRWGSLDDIGLLADLAALPPQRDEHPHERAALLHAMQRIAGLTTTDFAASSYAADSITERTWECVKCGTHVPALFDVCWACGTSAEGTRRTKI
ncbi:MAG TPA: hypothetical protein VGX78_11170 [Pirellulales bacterium]|nr:hypothetical protein [Pirellulales bacterium]